MANLGSGNGTTYPASLDIQSTPEVDSPSANKTKARAAVPNDLAAAVIAIETALGTNPQGITADVKTFLQTEHNNNGKHNIITSTDFITKGPWFDIRALGATGNGTTDDSTNMQSVLTAVGLAGGGVVLVPALTFACGTQLEVYDNTIIIGCGLNSIIRTITNNVVGMVHNKGGLLSQNKRIIIRNVHFDGNNLAMNGIWYENVIDCIIEENYLENIGINNASSNAMIMYAGENVRVTHNKCINSNNNVKGIWFTNTKTQFGEVSDNTIKNCYIGIFSDDHTTGVIVRNNNCQSNRNNGINIDLATNLTLMGNTCLSNSGIGISFTNSSAVTISGNLCSGNTSDGIKMQNITTTTEKLSITGNTVVGNSGVGINFSTVYNSTIVGNVIMGGTDGVLGFNSLKCTVSGNRIGSNSGYGVHTTGTSDYFATVGNCLTDNTLGETSLVGTNNVTASNV